MRDIFKGFLVLKLVALLALLIAGALIVGISAFARGSDVVGVAVLAAVVIVTAALGSLVVHRARQR